MMSTAIKTKAAQVKPCPTAPPVTVNAERMSGQAVIAISRVPVTAILDHVNRETFQRDFPSITEDELERAVDYLKELAEDGRLGELVSD